MLAHRYGKHHDGAPPIWAHQKSAHTALAPE